MQNRKHKGTKMVRYQVSKLNMSKITLSLLLSFFSIPAYGMFQKSNNLLTSVTRHFVVRNTYNNFQKMGFASLSSGSNNFNQNNFNNSNFNWAIGGGAFGLLGAGAYAANQDLQSNSPVNESLQEIENNKLEKQQVAPSSTLQINAQPKQSIFKTQNNGVLTSAAVGLQNFMGMQSLQMDSKSSDFEKIRIAIKNGRLNHVRLFLEDLAERGIDCNIQDDLGFTPLYYAVSHRKIEIVKYLIEHGANCNISDGFDSPLTLAIRTASSGFRVEGNTLIIGGGTGDEELIMLLIKGGADVNHIEGFDTPLQCAIRFCHGDIVALLLRNGADINKIGGGSFKELPINLAVREYCFAKKSFDAYNRLEIISILLAWGADLNIAGEDDTPLSIAVKYNKPEMIKLLLSHDADVNIQDKYGRTPLYCAVAWGHQNCLKILLEAKADPNVQNKNGETPLHKACYSGDLACVQDLLSYGANVNAEDKNGETPLFEVTSKKIAQLLIDSGAEIDGIKSSSGATPLHNAVLRENIEVIQFLIDSGVDVSARINSKSLIIAARRGNVDVVRILIDSGADINIKNKYGGTPLGSAVLENDIKMTQFLVDRGADLNVRLFHSTSKEIRDILKAAEAKRSEMKTNEK